jgi:hypothetical protein
MKMPGLLLTAHKADWVCLHVGRRPVILYVRRDGSVPVAGVVVDHVLFVERLPWPSRRSHQGTRGYTPAVWARPARSVPARSCTGFRSICGRPVRRNTPGYRYRGCFALVRSLSERGHGDGRARGRPLRGLLLHHCRVGCGNHAGSSTAVTAFTTNASRGHPLVARICCVSRHARQVETSGFSTFPTSVMIPGV